MSLVKRVQLLAVYVSRTFTNTAHLLVSSGSLVNYWRPELGGHPDEDDPYDIQPGVEVFKERLKFSRGMLGDPLESTKGSSAAGSQSSGGGGWAMASTCWILQAACRLTKN